MGFSDRLVHAWNAFMGREPFVWEQTTAYYGNSSDRPFRNRLSGGNGRSIIAAIYNRISMDCAAIDIKHVQLDTNGRYMEDKVSGLNYCLTTSANIDQTARAFIQDCVLTMLDEGVIAIVPTDTDIDPRISASYDIKKLRVGRITKWYPEHIRIRLYNEKKGTREEITLPKSMCAIVENPFYSIMNEPNSTLQRLMRKMTMIDAVDEQTSSGKLNMIIQLPYIIKSEARKKQAEARRTEIENQLAGSKYGIAYTDGTEKITQLNKSLENNLLGQIESLTALLYTQLGMPQSVFDGTADEQTMLNYNNRTIEPIVSALTNEMNRKFLTKTARTQKQAVMFFREPFKLVPVNQIAEIADKFTRNEIMSSNEIRQIVGLKPVDNPEADELRNKNLNRDKNEIKAEAEGTVASTRQEPVAGEAIAHSSGPWKKHKYMRKTDGRYGRYSR